MTESDLQNLKQKVVDTKMIIHKDIELSGQNAIYKSYIECLDGMIEGLNDPVQPSQCFQDWKFGLFRIFTDSAPSEDAVINHVIEDLFRYIYSVFDN